MAIVSLAAACGAKTIVPGNGKFAVETFKTKHGEVAINLIKHGSIAISFKDITIQCDPVGPYRDTTDYATDFGKAAFIFITHEHGDHFNPETIATLYDEHSVLVLNEKSQNQLGYGDIMHNGDARQLTKDIKVEAVPAYNTTPGRERMHPYGNGNGYVFTIDGLRIYVAGDTEDVPEMANLKDIDVAFLPINQPNTMTVEQAVNAVGMFHPKVMIPYHFGRTDVSVLPGMLPDTDVRLHEMQ
jgi:L-ascorbate metabolism protein UlaG (beta-lactamase superfamily)